MGQPAQPDEARGRPPEVGPLGGVGDTRKEEVTNGQSETGEGSGRRRSASAVRARSNVAILTEYRGLKVKDLAGLRRSLR